MARLYNMTDIAIENSGIYYAALFFRRRLFFLLSLF